MCGESDGCPHSDVALDALFQDLMAKTGSEQAMFEALEQAGGGPFAEPEDVARAVAFLVSDDARPINGVELRVDGGFVL